MPRPEYFSELLIRDTSRGARTSTTAAVTADGRDGWTLSGRRDYAHAMHRHLAAAGVATLVIGAAAGALLAQQPAPPPTPYFVGNRARPADQPGAPTARSTPMSANVKVYGAIYSAESCSYDAERDLIVVPNRGVPPERADQQRLGLAHQPRRVGPHRALDRRAEPGATALR